MPEITLCIDSATREHPELIGLEGETLASQEWLNLYTQGQHARDALKAKAAREVWVSGCDDVDPINLAAAIKGEQKESKVCLLAFHPSGSLHSRARAAGIDEVLDCPAFVQRYQANKHICTQSSSEKSAGSVPEVVVRDVPKVAAVSPQAVSPAAPLVASQGASQVVSQTVPQMAPQTVSHQMAPQTVSPPSQVQSQRFKPVVHQMRAQAHRGFVLAVVGAGGGTGKSSVSVLAACASAAAGLKTVLVDADLQFGDIHHLMGSSTALKIDQAVAAPARLDALVPEQSLPAIVAAPDHLEQSETLCSQIPTIVERLRQRFDVIIVNTGSWFNEAQLQLIEQSSNVLFVIDQRPSSVRACKHALELCARCGVAAQPFLFALNRCSRHALFSSIDVSCALQGVHVDELQDGGREVEELLGAGCPLELMASKNAFSASVKRLMEGILPRSGSNGATLQMPSAKRRRRFPMRDRKKAACL